MPGYEFVELCDLVVGDAAKNVGEPGLRIDATELCRQVCKTWFQGGDSGPFLFLLRVCCGSTTEVQRWPWNVRSWGAVSIGQRNTLS